MNKVKQVGLVMIAFSVFFSTLLSGADHKANASVAPFPIGIFYPPGPTETTSAKYEQIKDMNANLIIGAGVLVTEEHNDAALTLASSKGLRMLVDDYRFHWRNQLVSQNTFDTGFYVSSGNRLGQTFKTPAGTDWHLSYVQLHIDPVYWGAATILTLSIYDSPARTTLIGSSSVNGPATAYHHGFGFGNAISSNTTYYMELTSNSPVAVGWVTGSSTNTYADGMLYNHGTAMPGNDLEFDISFTQKAYNDGNRPADSLIDTVVSHYQTKSGMLGYHIYDEPGAPLFTRIAAVRERLRLQDPSRFAFVNLFPINAVASLLKVNEVSGEFSRPTSVLGQTFTTAAGQTSIDTIQIWLDSLQWGAGEALTLSLWNSPAKTALISQTTLTSTSNNWPVFNLNATVLPNTSYYWELVHNGGGDQQIGWVIRMNDHIKMRNGGTGYVNGTPLSSDFWFTIDQNIQGGTYEDYVYRWAIQKPDVMAFDHYPFLANGTIQSSYYTNLEIIRKQALIADIDFWSYLQSVGITGYLRKPSEADLRYQIYTNLAYGAKGYIYFTYRTPGIESSGEPFHNGLVLPDGTLNDTYTYAANLNAQVEKLGPTLLTLNSQAVYHTGTLPASTTAVPGSFFWQPTTTHPSVIGYFTNNAGRKFVLVVNRDVANTRSLSFNISGTPSTVTEVSKTTGLEVSTSYLSSTGLLTGTFAPGEGKLYALPSGY